jgi:hypothetical protein
LRKAERRNRAQEFASIENAAPTAEPELVPERAIGHHA